MTDPIHILVVEDDPTILELIRDVLSDDYEVETAQDASTGLELLRRNRHPLLILDLGRQGGMDGPELVRLIRSSKDGITHTPIVIVSAYPEMRKRFPEGAVSGFIAKPFLIENMLRVVTAAIRPAVSHDHADNRTCRTGQ